MNFEKIRLPDFIVADLYKDCLVEPEPVTHEIASIVESNTKVYNETPAVHHSKTLQYLGDNKKNIAVIINEQKADVISEGDLTFLMNVLKACNLNLADIAIVNHHNQEVLFTLLREQLDPEKIILLNVDPSSINLPFSIPAFQVHTYAGCTILPAPALSVLNQPTEESRLLKTKLWTSLRQLFNL